MDTVRVLKHDYSQSERPLSGMPQTNEGTV